MDIDNSVRLSLLQRCNTILDTDNYIGDADRSAWRAYRNALLELDTSTEAPAFPQMPPEPNVTLTPAKIAERNAKELDRTQLRTEFQSTIDTLTQIETATSPTNAQIVAAVKFLAKTQRLILKLLARMI